MTMMMKALTVWQPWATLIALKVKPYEFRGWPAPAWIVGARIAIHAGARKPRRGEIADLLIRLRSAEAWTTGLKPGALEILDKAHADPAILPLSAVVCTAMVGGPVRSHEIRAELGGPVNDSDRPEHSNWAWPMLDVEELMPPVEARGAQGLWNWREDVRA